MKIIHLQPSEASSTESIMCGSIRPLKTKLFTDEMIKLNALIILVISILFSAPVFGQKANRRMTITGVVINSKQQPVAGAVIFINGVKTVYVTDNQGQYKINVSTKARKILVLSPEYGTKEAEINGRTSIDFTLTGTGTTQDAQINKQNDMVDIGYGKMKKEDISSSVSKTEVQNSKYSLYSDVFAILNEMPGVTVNGTKVVIQGSATYGGNNEPLYVVDGITKSRIDDISPTIIQSISVLKGASAAVYGIKSANGVIIITTSRYSDKK